MSCCLGNGGRGRVTGRLKIGSSAISHRVVGTESGLERVTSCCMGWSSTVSGSKECRDGTSSTLRPFLREWSVPRELAPARSTFTSGSI